MKATTTFQKFIISVLLCLICSTQSWAQSKLHEKAREYYAMASKSMNAGDIKTADSLIKISIKVYPTMYVFNYASKLARLSDIVGANLIMDRVIARAQMINDEKILIIVRSDTVSLYKYEAIQEMYMAAVELNHQLGKKADYRKASERAFPSKDYPKTEFEKMREEKRWDEALKYARKYKSLNIYIYNILVQAGRYDEAILYIKNDKKRRRPEDYLFRLYVLKGDLKEAALYYEKLDKDPEITYNSCVNLVHFDMLQKNYQKAFERLGHPLFSIYSSDATRWEYYMLLGKTYTGLKDYVKAKDNLSIALYYDPEYKEALAAVAELETIVGQETATDKTPPVIVITEPAPNRGLKVTAVGSNVMVKGNAADLSGIKEVSINGKVTYSQASGDFWADVLMVNGINKITVTATDLAGNKAEKTFEIEKQANPVIVSNEVAPVIEKVAKNYCLLIASQNYSDRSIPTLANPIADAVKLKLILKSNYNYPEENIISLFNPTNNDIKRKLLELGNTIQPEDNLVIFYAGHGIWVEKEKKGYWLMTDAQYKDINTWLPNKVVLDLVAKLPSRHTLLITDACFSGSVFKTRGISDKAPTAIKELDNKITRVAITSGNDTEVPDESIFMKYLIKALSQNKEQYLTAQKMFINQIIEAVMAESKTEPRYGTLELAGHVGGDFIFSRK
ncbi:MAG: caspase family protein [Bacteroidota bacterium]